MDSEETSTENQENELNEVDNIIAEDSAVELQEETDSAPQLEEESKEKLVQLPIGRIKHIVKMDPDVNLVNAEAIFLITKSTELFIESLAKEAYKYTSQAKKKTVQKHDVQSAIENVDALVFLEGAM